MLLINVPKWIPWVVKFLLQPIHMKFSRIRRILMNKMFSLTNFKIILKNFIGIPRFISQGIFSVCSLSLITC